MDAFINAITYQHQAFLHTANGDIWRVWFAWDGQPLMEKLILPSKEYAEAISKIPPPPI